MLKNKKGITLIALVITIIVLLILAGVALSALMGDSGILTNAEKAKENTAKSNVREQLGLAVQQALIEGRGEIKDPTDLNNELNQILGTTGKEYVTGETAPFKVTVNGDEFKVQGNGKIEIDQPMKDYASTTKDAKGLLTANATFTSNGLTAVVPKGFKIVNGVEGTQEIAKGLVIQDAKENEFVWIPVTYEGTEDSDGNGYYDAFEAVFKRTTAEDSDYSEPYEQGYTNEDGTTETDDYNDMMLSVQKNKGFYIGRYEAGTATPRYLPDEFEANSMLENPETTVVIQKGAYPYNNVAWGKSMDDYMTEIKFVLGVNDMWDPSYIYDENGTSQGHGAVYLSKNLLKNQITGATSTLCYGVQLDAVENFIDAYTDKDVDYPTSWGNHYENTFAFTGKYSPDRGATWQDATDELKPLHQDWLLTTGASETNKALNIYDVVGNLQEWTMEAYSSSTRTYRSSWYLENSVETPPISWRIGGLPTSCYDYVGFRPTLYITN